MPNSKTATSVALRETLWLALDTLRAHKLRSFLTLLGVILAVFTLVAVMSVVDGLNLYITDRLANLGTLGFVVNKTGIITSRQEFEKAQKRPPVRMEDFEAVREYAELPQNVAAADDALTDVRYGSELQEDVILFGVTANYADLRSIGAAHGRSINENDDLHRAPVCFIGQDLAKRFFPHVDPVGKSVRAGSQSYQVVGVAKTQGSVFGLSRDKFLHIPLSVYLKHWFGPRDSLFLVVQVRHPEWMEATQDEVRAILRARRHVPYKEPDNFGIIAPSSITGLWEKLTGKIFAIAVGLTSVFLVVGGVVIMNIMLASVTERTREIGIRKSVGARRRHIVTQFLVESVVLAGCGGLIGILLAAGAGAIVTATTFMPIRTSLSAVALALTMSTSVGLFFGIYPAVRAARLDPIEALRAET